MNKLKAAVAVCALTVSIVPMAQATTYHVYADFYDGGWQGHTFFDGSFDWDGSTLSNFSGFLSEAMWGWSDSGTNGAGFYANGTGGGLFADAVYTSQVYTKPGGYADDEAPLLHLTYDNLVVPSIAGGYVTATTFLQNSSDVVWGGGYDVKTDAGNYAYGSCLMGTSFCDGNERNYNAFFTLVFDAADPTDTSATWNQIVYADDTSLGTISPMLSGVEGMTGFDDMDYFGSMGGYPAELSITAAPVPVPGAVWLFGSALTSLLAVVRRKRAFLA